MRESPTWAIVTRLSKNSAADHGRAHALAMRLRARGLVDDLVGAGDGIAQDDAGRDMPVSGSASVQVLALDGFAYQVDDGLDGDAAGHFAGVVAAHAVGQHDQAQFAVEGDRVLVVLADAAGVGQADALQLPFQAHQSNRT